jgi:hypothetical protein
MFREHDIRPFSGGTKPPTWPLVPAMVSSWVGQVNALPKTPQASEMPKRPSPEILAEPHNEFERIHPFLDGAGRTGRLILNLVLVRLGYPPVIILKRQRDHYLTAMQKADAGDAGPLGEILARALYDSLNRFLLPRIAGSARLVPLAALASDEFSVAALRQAAQCGRLDAMQGADGLWLSSRKAVDDYRQSQGLGKVAFQQVKISLSAWSGCLA